MFMDTILAIFFSKEAVLNGQPGGNVIKPFAVAQHVLGVGSNPIFVTMVPRFKLKSLMHILK